MRDRLYGGVVNDILDLDGAAALLLCSSERLRQRAAAGEVPGRKVGRLSPHPISSAKTRLQNQPLADKNQHNQRTVRAQTNSRRLHAGHSGYRVGQYPAQHDCPTHEKYFSKKLYK
jgi:hypothetical protein